MLDFWKSLKAPLFMLAPMEDVTDTVFRELILSVSSGDILQVVFTEFTSTDGLQSEKGSGIVAQRLFVSPGERNLLERKNIRLVAQIWGNDPEKFHHTARMVYEMGSFDGIDINMGCPVKKVISKNACSALIRHPELVKDIIHATKEASPLPVSVKTRIGFHAVATEEWIGHLLESELSAIIIHGRTQKMQSEGRANWEEIAKAVKLRDRMAMDTLIIGNGDVSSFADGCSKIQVSGANGVMVGRGIFKSPWLFNPDKSFVDRNDKIALLMKHVDLFASTWKKSKNINVLKRFFKIYINGFEGAVSLRAALMRAGSEQEIIQLIKECRKLDPEYASVVSTENSTPDESCMVPHRE
jgi:tRNA-dihydrouridine synthase